MAADNGHAIVWSHSTPDKDASGSSTATGYVGRCTNPHCRIAITVDDDNSEELTLPETPIPTCPLNSSR